MGLITLLARALAVASLFSLVGCAMAAGVNDQRVVHNVDFLNMGESDVYDFSIKYGDLKIPSPTGENVFSKGERGGFGVTMPVPEVATVYWRDSSGGSHIQEVQIRSKIPVTDMNLGVIQFVIKDSILEINAKVKIRTNDRRDVRYEVFPISTD